jgi:hypothetical protein
MVLLEKLKDEIEIVAVTPEEVQPFIEKHYLGNWPKGIKKIYGILHMSPDGERLVGTIIYGDPRVQATKEIEPEAHADQVLELKRLFIIDELNVPNVESFVIAKSLKMIKQEFPNIKVIITFADSRQGHRGIVYQATNAIYLGIKSGKHKYAYILRGNLNALNRLLQSKPYPKKDN